MTAGRLCIAAAAGNVAKVEALILKEGANVEERDEEGLTPMMTAARAGKLKVIQRLLEISQPDLNAFDKGGRTALDHAEEAQQYEVVTYMTLTPDLVPFGHGLLPAIANGRVAVVQELVASTDERLHLDVNVRDSRGASALHLAVRAGNEAVLEALLRQPAIRVNPRDRYGRTPLDATAQKNAEGLTHLLRSHGGKASDELNDDEG